MSTQPQPPDGAERSAFPSDMPIIVQRTVINRVLPALFVIHDDEGDWLVGDGINDPNLPGASGVYHISHLLEIDPTIAETAGLPLGHFAERNSIDDPWKVARFQYED